MQAKYWSFLLIISTPLPVDLVTFIDAVTMQKKCKHSFKIFIKNIDDVLLHNKKWLVAHKFINKYHKYIDNHFLKQN